MILEIEFDEIVFDDMPPSVDFCRPRQLRFLVLYCVSPASSRPCGGFLVVIVTLDGSTLEPLLSP